MHTGKSSFQELADEAFTDLLKKHKQPVGLMASLKESVSTSRARQKERGIKRVASFWGVPVGT
jgi:hypothetical protein